MVLDRNASEVFLGGPGAVHVVGGCFRVDIHEDRLVPAVGADLGEDLREPILVQRAAHGGEGQPLVRVIELLGTHRQRNIDIARRDREPRLIECRRP